jgi:hypothetical protein
VVKDEIIEDMIRSGPTTPAKRFEVGGQWQVGLELGFCESPKWDLWDLWD